MSIVEEFANRRLKPLKTRKSNYYYAKLLAEEFGFEIVYSIPDDIFYAYNDLKKVAYGIKGAVPVLEEEFGVLYKTIDKLVDTDESLYDEVYNKYIG